MNNIFYVYIYLDPRKNGGFKYGDYEFECETCYVGKGHGRRDRESLTHAYNEYDIKNGKRDRKDSIIRKLKKELNLEPIISKIKENITDGFALELEKKVIKIIGRSDLGKGPLVNLTDGGEGPSGYIATEEHRRKNRESHKGRVFSEETIKRMSETHKGKKDSEETRKKKSEARKGEKNPMWGKTHSEETRRKKSESNKLWWSIPENKMKGKNNPMFGKIGKDAPMFGKHHSEETKERLRKINLGKKHTKETIKKMSEKKKGKPQPHSMCGENHPHKREVNRAKFRKPFICTDVVLNKKFITNNLMKFCEDNNLSYGSMTQVACGNNKIHKDRWICKRIKRRK